MSDLKLLQSLVGIIIMDHSYPHSYTSSRNTGANLDCMVGVGLLLTSCGTCGTNTHSSAGSLYVMKRLHQLELETDERHMSRARDLVHTVAH